MARETLRVRRADLDDEYKRISRSGDLRWVSSRPIDPEHQAAADDLFELVVEHVEPRMEIR